MARSLAPARAGSGAMLALMATFASSFLPVAGLLPLWDTLRHRPCAQAALRGGNAA